MLVEPVDGQLLSFLAFFTIYTVVLDPPDDGQFLNSLGPQIFGGALGARPSASAAA